MTNWEVASLAVLAAMLFSVAIAAGWSPYVVGVGVLFAAVLGFDPDPDGGV